MTYYVFGDRAGDAVALQGIAIPEPASVSMLLVGAAGALLRRRRRKRLAAGQ